MSLNCRNFATESICSFKSMSTSREIEVAILRLSGKDRLHPADKILGSLPPPSEAVESLPQRFLFLIFAIASTVDIDGTTEGTVAPAES